MITADGSFISAVFAAAMSTAAEAGHQLHQHIRTMQHGEPEPIMRDSKARVKYGWPVPGDRSSESAIGNGCIGRWIKERADHSV
jgi:hypothetical protein